MLPLKALKTSNLVRYQAIARLLIKYGRSDIVKQVGLYEALKETHERPGNGRADPRELANDLELLGPTYIKIGQNLSTRADMLPFEYLEALARLQDNVEPFPFAQVQQTIEEELGVRLKRAFPEFEEKPMAAASLGQVHRAVLPSGRAVAVKVQRPHMGKQIVEDFEALEYLAEALDKYTELGRRYEFTLLLEEVRRSLVRELDYSEEGRNLQRLAANLKRFPRIVVPLPVEEYTTPRVLTMEYIHGTKITALSPVVLLEIDRRGLLEEVFASYLHQILVEGFFHADPHPGNIFLTDKHQIALLDLGQVYRLAPQKQEQVLKLLLAMSEGRGKDAALIVYRMSEAKADVNETAFYRETSSLVLSAEGTKLKNSRFGQTFMSLQRVAAENGVRLPTEFRMIAKALLNLERVAAVLDDTFSPSEAVRRNAMRITRRRLYRDLSTTNIIANIAEVKDLIERFPRRLNAFLDTISSKRFELSVDAIDEALLMTGFQKVANRITVGLVIAAMIIGAAIIMNIETRWTIFGYPALAIVLFLFAALVGGGMVLHILWHDIKGPDAPKPRRKT
ncbi:MAG: AarF/ABC1/UbiB kinase family protein [Candidatus Hydrogenedentes bacterium]|nr:AarF/ABC1/UbiB kinase family protein [Candidatus Hydrogenedentota bacterium]